MSRHSKKRTHKKEMSLEDYTTNDVEIGCDRVVVEPGDCRQLEVVMQNICWIDIAGELARCDEDFIECFMKTVREIQENS